MNPDLIFALALAFLFVLVVMLGVMLLEARRDIICLRRELSEKVSDTRHGHEVEYRRQLMREVAAIQRHLKIEITEEPARMVVKETP